MPRTHDGITCRMPPNPVALGVGLVAVAGGVWLAWSGHVAIGVCALVAGLVVLLNQKGSRRVRVIQTKLLVEDERLLTALLVGPRRRRVEWERVRGMRIEGGALVVDTDGAPFVTAQGAAREDLDALKASAEAAWTKARSERAEG